jgi:hypothetical protein
MKKKVSKHFLNEFIRLFHNQKGSKYANFSSPGSGLKRPDPTKAVRIRTDPEHWLQDRLPTSGAKVLYGMLPNQIISYYSFAHL